MAGIVCTALSLPSPGSAADLWLPPSDDRWRCASLTLYCAGTAVILGAVALGSLSFAESAAAAISLGTVCTLCARGSFGGPASMAGQRLRSPEFLLQYLWIIWVMAFIFSDTAATLRAGCSGQPNCVDRLTSGSEWLLHSFGLQFVDRSDAQWSFFRAQLPLLSGVAAAFLSLSAALRAVRSRPDATSPTLALYCIAGVGFLVIVHGSGGALFFALAATVNYLLALACASSPRGWLVPWAFALGFMCTGEWYGSELYKWRVWLPEPYGGLLDDAWGGMAPRWWVYAGVSLLRMIAFSFDYRWAVQQQRSLRSSFRGPIG